jgi:hypothetical protein
MINYLSRRINPTGEVTLLPGEVEMFGQARILDRFQRHPPDWIVAVQTSVAEFGYAGFGVDYAQDVARFIKDNYDNVPLGNPEWILHLLRFDPGHVLMNKGAATPRASSPAMNSPGLNSPAAGEDASHPR